MPANNLLVLVVILAAFGAFAVTLAFSDFTQNHKR